MKDACGRFGLAPMIVLLGAMAASAETINISGMHEALIGTVTVGGKALSGETTGTEYYIGSLSSTLTGAAFDTYCIDLNHDFTAPTSWSVNSQSTFDSSASDTDTANDSSSNFAVIGSYQKLAYLIDMYGAGATTADAAAALQIALWTVEYGSGVVVTVTSDRSNVTTLLDNDISAVNTASTATLNASAATFYVATNAATPHQDLIALPTGQLSPLALVPEPSSVAMMATGLGVVVLRSRKARRARLGA